MERKTQARVRTVLGDIPPESLGVCYAHEHVIIDSPFIAKHYPELQLDSVDLAVGELSRFYHDGGRAMVDSMPWGCGRNVVKMAKVSELSGVHLLVPTGVHLEKYYPPGHWKNQCDPEKLADWFIHDIMDGIDARDTMGSGAERTGLRAGLIKVATGGDTLDSRERRIFKAAVEAHKATGAPILTHTEAGRGGLAQIKVFRDLGADLRHVVLSHTDRHPETDYHRRMLLSGVRLEYDSAFRWKGNGNPTLDLLVELYPEFPEQLLLGMDAARRSYWKAYGGRPGLSYLLTTFRKAMSRRGMGNSAWNQIMVKNPALTYSLRPLPEGF